MSECWLFGGPNDDEIFALPEDIHTLKFQQMIFTAYKKPPVSAPIVYKRFAPEVTFTLLPPPFVFVNKVPANEMEVKK